MSRELCDERFPMVKFVVPGLFPEGVVLLVSRPKRGKSWLLQQVGSAVARGVSTLVSSDEPPAQGDVLYLNLEDGERRAQRRMTKHFGSMREAWPEHLTLAFKWKRLEEGGFDDLRGWCKSVLKPTLIMIDTLKRVRVPKKKNCTDYDADYEACQGLLDLSHEFPGLVIIAACHDRKMEADDIFDTVSGTLGLTGGVDTIAIIKRTAQGTTLHIQGRDLVDDVEKAVLFDRETLLWSILGVAAVAQRSGVRAAVIAALGAAPAEGLGVTAIMQEANLSSRGAADALLGRMVKDGDIERRSLGKYSLSGASASDPALDALDSQKRARTH